MLLYLPIIILTILTLFYVSYQDIKFREINTIPLIVLSIVSIIYVGFFIFGNNLSLWKGYFIQLIIVFVFLLIFLILGKISKFAYIGEGDLYTIMAISFTNIFSSLFILSLFLISLFVTLCLPIILFIYNLVIFSFPKHSFFKAVMLMFLGMKKKLTKITDFYTPLEKIRFVNNRVIREVTIKPNIDSHKLIANIKRLSKRKGVTYLWVSPLVPFIIYILIAYLIILFIIYSGYFINFSSFIINFV